MSTRLINVRLAADDASKADALKADGVALSKIVREAIRAEYVRRFPPRRTGAKLAALLEDLHARYPLPEHLPRPAVDMTDRLARQRYIREHLERKSHRTRQTTKRPKTS